jgi:hypothetical protein
MSDPDYKENYNKKMREYYKLKKMGIKKDNLTDIIPILSIMNEEN